MQKPNILPTQIDINQTTATVCEECKCEVFKEAIMLREVSALLTKNGQGGFIPIQVFACIKCGHVNQKFIPEELRRKISL